MGILWIIAAALVVLWLFGLVANVVGPILHLLLVLAAVVFVASMFTGRRTIL